MSAWGMILGNWGLSHIEGLLRSTLMSSQNDAQRRGLHFAGCAEQSGALGLEYLWTSSVVDWLPHEPACLHPPPSGGEEHSFFVMGATD